MKKSLIVLSLLFLSSCAFHTVETKVLRLKNCKRVSIYWDFCDIDKGGEKGMLVQH